jgi:hypothetical protein
MNNDLDDAMTMQTAVEDHDEIMADIAVVLKRYDVATLIHKTNYNARVRVKQDVQDLLDGDDYANGDETTMPPFTAEQVDVIATVIMELRQETRNMIDDAVVEATAPLRERVAMLEGQVSTLVMLISDNNKSFEATETVRKMRIGR